MEHDAIQYSDQMQCKNCGRAWDVNDSDVPPCTIYIPTHTQTAKVLKKLDVKKGHDALSKIIDSL